MKGGEETKETRRGIRERKYWRKIGGKGKMKRND